MPPHPLLPQTRAMYYSEPVGGARVDLFVFCFTMRLQDSAVQYSVRDFFACIGTKKSGLLPFNGSGYRVLYFTDKWPDHENLDNPPLREAFCRAAVGVSPDKKFSLTTIWNTVGLGPSVVNIGPRMFLRPKQAFPGTSPKRTFSGTAYAGWTRAVCVSTAQCSTRQESLSLCG